MILKRHLTSMRATFRPIMHAWSFKFSELLYHARTYHDLRYQNWTPPPPPHKITLGTCCYTPTPHKNPSELVAIPPLLTKKTRNLLLCTSTPHKKRSELVVISPLLTKKPRNLLFTYFHDFCLSQKGFDATTFHTQMLYFCGGFRVVFIKTTVVFMIQFSFVCVYVSKCIILTKPEGI